ncbi:MAG: hypothetical protein AAF805_02075 [Planctomycetota bacterium]
MNATDRRRVAALATPINDLQSAGWGGRFDHELDAMHADMVPGLVELARSVLCGDEPPEAAEEYFRDIKHAGLWANADQIADALYRAGVRP